MNRAGPLAPISPELLAKMAAANFRPPGLMSAPGQPGMGQIPQQAAIGMQVPSGGLGLGWGMGGNGRTAGDADLGGYSTTPAGGMVDVGGGQMLPNPNGMTYGSDGMPIGPAQGAGLLERLGLSNFQFPSFNGLFGK